MARPKYELKNNNNNKIIKHVKKLYNEKIIYTKVHSALLWWINEKTAAVKVSSNNFNMSLHFKRWKR